MTPGVRLSPSPAPWPRPLGVQNPIRYRGYYYDTETGLYYINSRYYDPVVGRWISGDGEISGVGGELLGYNLFAYCFNNPINMSDPTGHWPKWLTGAINVVGGALQAVAGAALVAAAPVSGGFSAVVGGALLINGAATIAAGAGQIINDVSNSNVMPEENAIKTSAKAIGKAIEAIPAKKSLVVFMMLPILRQPFILVLDQPKQQRMPCIRQEL